MPRNSRILNACVVATTACTALTTAMPAAGVASARPETVAESARSSAAASASELSRANRASNMIFSGPKYIKGRKAIYLTFDDGPAGNGTLSVLAALRAQRVRATFFDLGGLTSTRDGRRTVARLHAAGMPIGMHSWSHPNMARWSTSAVLRDFARTSGAIRAATGEVPTCFRPPYGAFGRGVTTAAAERNVRVVMWDIDTRDWTSPGAATVANRVISRLHPGAIVLMHDGAGHGRQAAAAIPRIVRAAHAKGYVFGTLCPMKPPRR